MIIYAIIFTIHSRLLQAAVVSASVLALAGCSKSGGTAQSKADRSPITDTAPAITGSEAQPLGVDGQYDVASDFMAGFDDTDLHGPVIIPESIINPTVRHATLKAAELLVAADAVTSADSWPIDGYLIKNVDRIQEPDVKAKAIDGIAKATYANILLGLIDGPTSEDITAEEAFLQRDLASAPDQYAKYKAKIDKLTAVSKRAQSELTGDPTKWSDDNDALTGAWSDAHDTSAGYASDLNDAAATAEDNGILSHSPKAIAESKKAEVDYQKGLHHCDKLPSPAKDKCAADEAVGDAKGGYDGLFAQWAPMVKDPTQELRIETAAADEAISDANGGYGGLYDRWARYVHDPAQKGRIEAAAANQAIEDIKGGYDGLATEWSGKVHNASDRSRINAAYEKAAESYYNQGYPILGDEDAGNITDPSLKAQATSHRK